MAKKKPASKKNGASRPMTNGEVVRFHNSFAGVKDLCGEKFVYAAARNVRKSLAHCKDLAKIVEKSEAFKEYDKLRTEICEKYARRDENGKAIMLPDGDYAIADFPAFRADTDQLLSVKEHAEAKEEHDKKIEGYGAMLAEQSDFKPYTIPRKDMPQGITAGQLEGIYEIVDESAS